VQDFNFYRAQSLSEALDILSNKAGKVKVISGGTDVMVDLRNNALPKKVELVLDIGLLDELKDIHEEDGRVHVGPAAPLAEVAEHPAVRDRSLVLHTAASYVGSGQIRNRGTVGGNIVTAAQCSDTVPALMVLDATIELKSSAGTRQFPVADFFTGPKTTAIEATELVTDIHFPVPPDGYRGTFEKLIRREAVAKSRLGVCVLADLADDGTIRDARLSIGSSLPSHARFPTVEKMLKGQKVSAELLHEAGVEAGEYMVRIGGRRWSTDYKQPVVQRLTERCLKRVLEVQ
jgi:CO/xanthine dehydrogenase FAD-binding subunit